MPDPFDAFLAEALAPPAGPADRAFVSRVQALVGLEQRIADARRRMRAAFVAQLLGIAAVTAGLLCVARAPAIAAAASGAPWPALCILGGTFGLIVLALARPVPTMAAPAVRERAG